MTVSPRTTGPGPQGPPAAPAVLHGGPLPGPDAGTLGDALLRAVRSPHPVVLVDRDGTTTRRTYRELYEDASRVRAGLAGAGVRPGARVVLRTTDAADLLAAFWACVLGGAVPLPVAGESGADVLDETAATVGEAWLAGDAAPAGLPARVRPLGPVSALRAAGAAGAPCGPPHAARPDDPAVLTLTSGSGGRPKAVPLTHRHLLSRARATALARGLGAHTRTLNWMPLDHVSGIVMFHVRDVLLGCHQVHADTAWVRADPLRWLDLADGERIDTTWAPSPAFAVLADRLAREPHRGWDLSRLRYVMNGGAPVKDRVVRRFLAALGPYGLPPDAVHPGWGMPETASGVVDSVFRPAGGPPRRFVPVGVPHPGVSVRVVDERGEVVPTGVVGRLQVTGAPVVRGYLEDGAVRPAPLSADGWLVTDDLAYVADGELVVTGRADGLLVLNGAAWYGHEIEDAVEELPCVLPASAIARPVTGVPGGSEASDAPREGDGGGPEALAVLFRPVPGVPPRSAEELVRAQVRSRFGAGAVRVRALAGAAPLSRTATGKLRRPVPPAPVPGGGRDTPNGRPDVTLDLNATMRTFATGLTVVTTFAEAETEAETETKKDGVRRHDAMVVSSFTSVSLDPPLVSLVVRRDCDLLGTLLTTGLWAVSILDVAGADLAQALDGDRETRARALATCATTPGSRTGCLVLDAPGWLECRLDARHDTGDHTVLIGEVLATGGRHRRPPLVSVNGTLRVLSET